MIKDDKIGVLKALAELAVHGVTNPDSQTKLRKLSEIKFRALQRQEIRIVLMEKVIAKIK